MLLGCCICDRDTLTPSSFGSSSSSGSAAESTVPGGCTLDCSVLPRRWKFTLSGFENDPTSYVSCCPLMNGEWILRWRPDLGFPGQHCTWETIERAPQQTTIFPRPGECGVNFQSLAFLNINFAQVTLYARAILYGTFGFSEFAERWKFIGGAGSPNRSMSDFNCLGPNVLYRDLYGFGMYPCIRPNIQQVTISPA